MTIKRHRPAPTPHTRALHRAARMRHYWKQQREFKAKGLTTRGTPRKQYQFHPELAGQPKRVRQVIYRRNWSRRLRSQGLLGSDQRRIYLSETECAWRELRATMQIQIPEIISYTERCEAA